MPGPPPPPKGRYSQVLEGAYGEFGSGAGLRAMYLQTAVSPQYLDNFRLIRDIPGSQRWPVRELFQREIDDERVSTGLLPYLKAPDKLKFFNPLTLTVLPIDERTGSVLDHMPRVESGSLEEDGFVWNVLERKDLYRLRWVPESPQYARLEWNGEAGRVVAIDGQHRLSALMRLKEDLTGAADGEGSTSAYSAFLDWRIPVVVVSFRPSGNERESAGVLAVVRNIFVYINSTAQKVGRARSILLDDESINSLAAQEMIQFSHDNDLKKIEERDEARLPLLFFDWRGAERGGQIEQAKAAAIKVTEICDWFRLYVLGEDFSDEQKNALFVAPGDDLSLAFSTGNLDHGVANVVRRRLGGQVLPALSELLQGFRPYARYASELRRLEREYNSSHDLSRHAFQRLRFGYSEVKGVSEQQIQQQVESLEKMVEDCKKDCLGPLFQREVGIRGVVQAFGDLWSRYKLPPWSEYASWFVGGLNQVWDLGHFREDHGQRSLLRHVVWNHNENIVHYKLEDARKALGRWVSLMVLSCEEPPEAWAPELDAIRDDLLEGLETTVKSGYKKELRPKLRPQVAPDRLTAEVNRRATEEADGWRKRFLAALDDNSAASGERDGAGPADA